MERDAEASSGGASASALFAEYVGRLEAGEEADFGVLSAGHPRLAEELRSLERNWRGLSEVFERLGFSGSLSQRLNGRFGPDVDPLVSLDTQKGPNAQADGFTSEVLGRLEERLTAFGRYRIQGELARGGQGIVLRVWDGDLRRNLAMKVALPKPGKGERLSLGRFLEEAQVTSQLDHPGIVPVHELGLDSQGRVYFTMKLVQGRDLRAVFDLVAARREGWSETRAVNVLMRVCEAMAYAHSKSVVHRDLKPANVMVGRFGEVFVMDWGLARILDREDRHEVRIRAGSADLTSPRRATADDAPDAPLITEDGDVVGTPAYMSPEQAQGRLGEIGPRSDVYSVGAMLYHLLAGRAPYERPEKPAGPYAILYRLQNGPPVSVAERAPDAPQPLMAICQKAMARDPQERYATMEELAEDLRAYLEGRVVRAFEAGILAECRRWIGRNRGLAASLAAALILALAGSVGVFQVRLRAERKALRQSYADALTIAGSAVEYGDVSEARRILESCPADLRGWEWRHLAFRCDTSLHVLRGHEGPITDVCASADSRLIASASLDGTVRLWDANEGRPLAILPHGAPVRAVEFGPSGSRILSGAEDRRLRAWDPESGSLLWASDELEAAPSSIVVDGGDRIVTGGQDGDLLLWKDDKASPLLERDSGLDAVLSLAVTGDMLVSGSRHKILIWDLEQGAFLRSFSHPGSALACSSLGRLACGLPGNGAVNEITLGTGAVSRKWEGHQGAVLAVAFDPDGQRLASGSVDETLRLWEAPNSTGEERAVLRGHRGRVECVAFGPDGSWLVSGSKDGTVRIWDSATQEVTWFALTHFGIAAVAFTPAGDRIVLCMASGDLLVLDAASGETLASHELFLYVRASLDAPYGISPELGIAPVAIGPEASWAAAFSGAGGLERREIESLATSALPLELPDATALAISPDGEWLAAGSGSGVVLQAAKAGEVPRLLGTPSTVRALAFLPDGRRVAAGLEDGSVQFWRLSDGRLLDEWKGRDSPVVSLAFDAAGSRAATSAGNGEIRIWELDGGRSLLVLAGESPSTALAFSPDGKRLVSCTNEGSLRLWESEVSTARGLWRAEQDRTVRYPSLQHGARPAVLEAARGLVGQLFQHYLVVDEVVADLQADESLDHELRSLAIALARERAEPTPAELLQVLTDPYRSSEAYERARRATGLALERDGDRASARFLLGAALYRLGEIGLAGQMLEGAWSAPAAEGGSEESEAIAAGMAFLALARAELGRLPEAREALERARSLAGPEGSSELRQLLREAAGRLR